ncbi:MAG: MauE/DoxX family redox-associated membrane protein [Phycisphaerae bacterium]
MRENKNGVLSSTGRCYKLPSVTVPQGVVLGDAELQASQDANQATKASWPARSGLFRTLRIVIGLTLVCSSSLKLWQFTHPQTVPPSLEGLTGVMPAVVGWVAFLGLWLLTGAFSSIARWTAIICFSLFSFYALYEAISGKSSCGCFGQVQVNPWFTVILDVAIVLALLFLIRPVDFSTRRAKRRWPIAVAMVIGLSVGVASAILHPKPPLEASGLATADGGGLAILEPDKWIGHRFPPFTHILLRHPGQVGPHGIPLSQRLAHGQWIVMLYHASCDECRRAIPVYEALARGEYSANQMPHVAFIRIPSDPPTPLPRELFHNSAAVHGALDTTHEWFATTPIAVELVAGKVIAAASGTAAMNLNWVK